MVRIQLVALLTAVYSIPVLGETLKELEDKGRPQVDARIAKSKTCTKENLQVRREW